MLLRRDSQLAVQGMVPDFLHVIPIADNTVLDWRLNLEHTALLLSLFAYVDFLLVETDHDAWHFGPADHC